MRSRREPTKRCMGATIHILTTTFLRLFKKSVHRSRSCACAWCSCACGICIVIPIFCKKCASAHFLQKIKETMSAEGAKSHALWGLDDRKDRVFSHAAGGGDHNHVASFVAQEGFANGRFVRDTTSGGVCFKSANELIAVFTSFVSA
jgi:hypothetical protein